jgi:hypothetical protein
VGQSRCGCLLGCGGLGLAGLVGVVGRQLQARAPSQAFNLVTQGPGVEPGHDPVRVGQCRAGPPPAAGPTDVSASRKRAYATRVRAVQRGPTVSGSGPCRAVGIAVGPGQLRPRLVEVCLAVRGQPYPLGQVLDEYCERGTVQCGHGGRPPRRARPFRPAGAHLAVIGSRRQRDANAQEDDKHERECQDEHECDRPAEHWRARHGRAWIGCQHAQ